ncbi:hypothetical protein HYH02_014445 [Chlamydomonas schloesseri]|uniref:Protein kinase domain-containing protein n=1 Tax=Chlamydomonas schloesseri TaxID=2026947 RepID=A0A835VSX7_9CHLO|nr:hypothetical protein HYH02_014445 [Chlamydomonas schloesseri]|eukprot:KAG2428097.1 hypothetical protein HYH02_014445 [Chlamydomonas schloesseri]
MGANASSIDKQYRRINKLAPNAVWALDAVNAYARASPCEQALVRSAPSSDAREVLDELILRFKGDAASRVSAEQGGGRGVGGGVAPAPAVAATGVLPAAVSGGGASGASAAVSGATVSPALEDVLDLPNYYDRFVKLLARGNITRPREDVLAAIFRRHAYMLAVVPDSNKAVELYRAAELFPGASTEGHLLTQHGLKIDGPLFPAEGSINLLTAATNEGIPAVVKLLCQDAGGAEAEACRVLMEEKPEDVPLVPAKILPLQLGAEHTSSTGRAPGLYAAMVMPRYVSSLAAMVPLTPAAVLAGAERISKALEWIHGKGFTHMDVKAANIFVDADGRWWLGDFGSAVRAGLPVKSTTTWFAPSKLQGLPAQPQYDWHMLAVALVCEVNRTNWKDLLIEGGCTPAHKLTAAVTELHGRNDCKALAAYLDELLLRAGHVPAPT